MHKHFLDEIFIEMKAHETFSTTRPLLSDGFRRGPETDPQVLAQPHPLPTTVVTAYELLRHHYS